MSKWFHHFAWALNEHEIQRDTHMILDNRLRMSDFDDHTMTSIINTFPLIQKSGMEFTMLDETMLVVQASYRPNMARLSNSKFAQEFISPIIVGGSMSLVNV